MKKKKKKLKKIEIKKICKMLSYESYPMKSIIIKEGEKSNGKLYIILSG